MYAVKENAIEADSNFQRIKNNANQIGSKNQSERHSRRIQHAKHKLRSKRE